MDRVNCRSTWSVEFAIKGINLEVPSGKLLINKAKLKPSNTLRLKGNCDLIPFSDWKITYHLSQLLAQCVHNKSQIFTRHINFIERIEWVGGVWQQLCVPVTAVAEVCSCSCSYCCSYWTFISGIGGHC